jgi:hypothetical protein
VLHRVAKLSITMLSKLILSIVILRDLTLSVIMMRGAVQSVVACYTEFC